MKIKSTIKLDSVKETTLPLLEKKFIIEPLVVILIFIILLLPIPSKNHPIITIGCVIGIVVQFLSFHVLIKSKIKVGTKYFTKTYPNNEYLLTIKLNKKDMVFENEYFTKSVKINYTDIAKIKKTKNYYIIQLTTKDYFLINNKDIDINEIYNRMGRVK